MRNLKLIVNDEGVPTTRTNRTLKKKEEMLTALKNTLGLVSYACRQINISRDTFYQWMKNDAAFAQSVALMHEEQLDFAEHALMQRIEKGDTTAIIFFLKCKAKERGYREREPLSPTGEKIQLDVTERLKTLLEKVAKQ